jgi:hypothetical protein
VGSSVDNGTILLSESSGWMDVLDDLASGMIRSRGGLGQGCLQFLEFCGHRESVSRLTALLVVVIGALDASPNGDETVWSWHL